MLKASNGMTYGENEDSVESSSSFERDAETNVGYIAVIRFHEAYLYTAAVNETCCDCLPTSKTTSSKHNEPR